MSKFNFDYEWRYVIYHTKEQCAFFVSRWYEYYRNYENISESSKQRLLALSQKQQTKDFQVIYSETDICIYSYRDNK